MHQETARPWTVAQLAKEAALSRSAFFERFSRAVGVAEVAAQVGYGSASAFSVAFTRHVGVAPARYLTAA